MMLRPTTQALLVLFSLAAATAFAACEHPALDDQGGKGSHTSTTSSTTTTTTTSNYYGGAGGFGGWGYGGTGIGGSEPAADCADICVDLMAAGCPAGPGTISECETGCTSAMDLCPTEFGVLAQCLDIPEYWFCDSFDAPRPAGCSTEWDALSACL